MAGGVSPVFHAEGDIIAYSTTISSDGRLKENVNPLGYGIKDLVKINPVSFDWKVNDKSYDIGFIAQEVLEIIPEIVESHPTIGETKDFLEKNYPMESTDRYTVDYAKLSVILTNSVKQQQKKIEELEKRIEELENGSSK